MLDPQLALIVLLLLALVVAAWLVGGGAQVREGLGEGARLLVRYGLLIVVSFLAAGVAQSLIPRELIEGALGERAGLRGILLATGAGAVTPAGPFVSMPIAAVLLRAGASKAAVVAFLTAWSLLAVHRLVAWETPILGLRFALLRYGISLVLPVLAGLLTRLVVRG
ncbi:MAG: permease [Myxococcota bacterium]|nr:permease [Myxococcota bacterium]